jgi:predicted metalloprotease with PDZ domain
VGGGHDDLDTGHGLRRHGWHLVFSDTPTEAFRRAEIENGVADLTYSAGLTVTDTGVVRTVAWEGPAFRAGLRPGSRITGVDGASFSRARLLDAVRGASRMAPRITVEQDGTSVERTLPYRGTLRYPLLERVAGVPDSLTALLAPR